MSRGAFAVLWWAVVCACGASAPAGHSEEVARVVSTARALRRAWELREHGASLRALIGESAAAAAHVEGEWEIYYDEESGHPYYYDAISGRTQWENPFAAGAVDDAGVRGGVLFESWQLYEVFGFVGVRQRTHLI